MKLRKFIDFIGNCDTIIKVCDNYTHKSYSCTKKDFYILPDIVLDSFVLNFNVYHFSGDYSPCVYFVVDSVRSAYVL